MSPQRPIATLRPQLLTLLGDEDTLNSLLNGFDAEVALLDEHGRLRWHSAHLAELMNQLHLGTPVAGKKLLDVETSSRSPENFGNRTAADQMRQLISVVLAGNQVRAEGRVQVPAISVPDPSPVARQADHTSWSSAPDVIDLRPHADHSETISAAVDVITTRISPRLVLVMVRDLTQARRDEHRLQYLAYHDSLTGLANRAAAELRLIETMHRSQRERTGFGLLYCDLDNFKKVNDVYGHRAGDELLRQIAERWTTWVRDIDLLARMSGDEFLLVADKVAGGAELAGLAHRLAESLATAFPIGGHRVRISMCSGGVYVPGVTRQHESSETLIAIADQALYRAKRRGDDQLVIEVISN